MKIRQHRGGLAESMATVTDIENTADAVARHVSSCWGYEDVTANDVHVKQYGYDGRIGWDTHIVLINGTPFGFSDGPLTDRPNTSVSGPR